MAEPTAPPRRRRGSLLTSYYGGTTDASGAPAEASVDPLDDMNIDTDGFNAPKYVGSLLQYKSLEQLVGRGNSMVSEIKSLDSDMQMLVYENYSKFISATDTIQEMKERVDGMEGAMKALEDNFGYISRASEAVSSSFSARRGELERLNTVKKTLKKLQFLMDLPARLQDCIAEGELALAVRCHAKAVKIMAAAGKHAAGFDGIRSECEQIMARLSSSLHERLQDESLPPDALCETVWLLLRLGGREDSLLPTFLERRRKALTTAINAFTPVVGADAAADAEGGADAAAAAVEGDGAEAPEAGEGDGAGGRGEGLSPARAPTRSVTAEHTRQLGALVVPQLLELVAAWRDKFGGEGGGGEASRERKEGMLAECVGEVCGALLEAVRQLMSEEAVPSEELLEGCAELLDAIAPLHEELPAAKLQLRATRLAEGLARRSVEQQLARLGDRLSGAVEEMASPDPDGDAPSGSLHAELRAVGGTASLCVRDALSLVAPLLAPLCELLRTRADGMALHLVQRLHAAVRCMLSKALAPRRAPRAVLLCAGCCLQMAAGGVADVPEALRQLLAPQGLAGAALGFDSAALTADFRAAADSLLQRFVEMQAQALSRHLSRRVQATDWLNCPPPNGVTPLVRTLVAELRAMQRVAASLFPSEPLKPMLPQGPFPPMTPLEQQLAVKLAASAGGGGGTASIQMDLQRIFARKVSFEAGGFGGGGKNAHGREPTLGGMVGHVAKLTLKTLVEEVRCATFSKHGFQQMQVDAAMLRWVLPAAADGEPLLALLDEAFLSCQERSLECVPLEHTVLEAFCENERRSLLAAIH